MEMRRRVFSSGESPELSSWLASRMIAEPGSGPSDVGDGEASRLPQISVNVKGCDKYKLQYR